MTSHTKPTIAVIGINGRIGHEVAKAFAAAGYAVTGLGRENRSPLVGVTFKKVDANSTDDLRTATADADIVVNALNLPYDKWDKGRAEAQLQRVLDAVKGRNQTLMFPGNVYAYGKTEVLRPETKEAPIREKGEIRQRMEQMLRAAASRGDVRVINVRAADFYGPSATGTMYDLALLSQAKSRRLQMPHKLAMSHSWAYLPDLGRAYVKLAEQRDSFAPYDLFHFEGHFADGHRLVATIQAVLPTAFKLSFVPWGLMSVIGLFVPVVREVVKMNYLFEVPTRLVDPRLRSILGEDFDTPFEEAVAETVRSLVPDALPAPTKLKLVA